MKVLKAANQLVIKQATSCQIPLLAEEDVKNADAVLLVHGVIMTRTVLVAIIMINTINPI